MYISVLYIYSIKDIKTKGVMSMKTRMYELLIDEADKFIDQWEDEVHLKFETPREIYPGWMLCALDYCVGFKYDSEVDGECDPHEIGNIITHMTLLLTSVQTKADVTVGGPLGQNVKIVGPSHMRELLMRVV